MYACWLKVTNRIWFTAASSGQETYSLAVLLKEAIARLAGWSKEIIGTYTSKEMLNRARTLRYSQFEVKLS
jgi:chemotaxis protein methyltransferase CheR|tara:strand:+ start:600 stop:812 length:213 start_codon:yes stop_codon:yes gene_type:complete